MSDAEQDRRAGIVARLYAALDQKMREIEERIEASARSGEGVSAADGERDARTLTSLARLFEKLSEIEGGNKGTTEATGAGAKHKESYAHRIRDEIAGRLERMLKVEQDRPVSE